MTLCVPIKDLRDTAAFDEMVSTSPTPVIVTKNGYDRFVCVKSSDFKQWEQAEARARLLERIMISERERAEGKSADAFEVTESVVEGEFGDAAAGKAAGQASEQVKYAAPALTHPNFDAFVQTVGALRAPDGCPWDKVQTHKSIASNMIEEAYEAVDTIEAGDTAHMREELGDVLLQVVLQSQIAADAGEFTIDDVCADVNAKIIRRHPHVFGDANAGDANEVLDLWDKVKLAEAKSAQNAEGVTGDTQPAGLLDGVPKAFPALLQAQKISRKAASAGFEWESVDAVWDKVEEEVAELKAAYAASPKSANGKIAKEGACATAARENCELELGDVLFSLVNVARKMGLDSEDALRRTCQKFRNRWAFMEGAAAGAGTTLEDMPQHEMEALWQMAKTLE
jgi:tetrapyrrole methylase family protein/MazG family protein